MSASKVPAWRRPDLLHRVMLVSICWLLGPFLIAIGIYSFLGPLFGWHNHGAAGIVGLLPIWLGTVFVGLRSRLHSTLRRRQANYLSAVSVSGGVDLPPNEPVFLFLRSRPKIRAVRDAKLDQIKSRNRQRENANLALLYLLGPFAVFYWMWTKVTPADAEVLDPEDDIARSVSDHATLVGIGEDIERFDSHSLEATPILKLSSSSEGWEQTFKELANRSLAILMVPGPTEAVLFELDFIRQHGELADKTFIILEPDVTETEWRKMAAAASAVGIAWPEYVASGVVYSMPSSSGGQRKISYKSFLNGLANAAPYTGGAGYMPASELWDRALRSNEMHHQMRIYGREN